MLGGRSGWVGFGAALALTVVGHARSAPALGAETPRPNRVLILLDNVGQEWFGCYELRENDTSHIERLTAGGGVRFEGCYVTPYCSTSRALPVTGRHPTRTPPVGDSTTTRGARPRPRPPRASGGPIGAGRPTGPGPPAWQRSNRGFRRTIVRFRLPCRSAHR